MSTRGAVPRGLVLLAVLVWLCGCTRNPQSSSPTERGGDVSGSATPPIVIAISMDGLNPDAIRQLGASAPHYRRLLQQGSGTLNARTAYELTDTLPNHTGMVTGRPIRGVSGHHVTFNSDRPETWLAQVAGHYVRGIFDLAHDRGLGTALYTSKDKFDFLDRSWDRAHGARDRTGADDGRDKIDTYLRTTPDEVLDRLIERLTTSPDRLVFWHNAVPDAAGHDFGFMSTRYVEAVRHTDAMLGRLFEALDRSPALRSRVTIVLSADHGGRGPSHRDPTVAANYRIPFLVWGRGVAACRDLYALNGATRRNPGDARPGYRGPQPIRNTDVANLVARLIGAPALAGSTDRSTLLVR